MPGPSLRTGCGPWTPKGWPTPPARTVGGQAQRIAIARALATEPDILLLDEPMAALDVAVAPSVRRLLRDILHTDHRTAVIVTHDLLDALAIANR